MPGALRRSIRPVLAIAALVLSIGTAAAEVRIGAAGSYAALVTAIVHDYRRTERDFSFRVLPDLGNAGAILAMRRRGIDVAVTTYPIEPTADMALRSIPVGRTPVVFVTSWRQPGLSLTEGEVIGILGLDWTAWPDGTPLRPILRPPMEGDYRVLARFAPPMREALERAIRVRKLPVALTVQENLDLAEEVRGSFTVSALTTIVAERRDLTVIRLDGIEPTPAALADGRYRFGKAIHIASRTDAEPAVHAFLDHLATAQSQALLLRLGVLPAAGD
ncbi:MAG: substrate-binding domain-containing protein [Rhodospirillales bacterium]